MLTSFCPVVGTRYAQKFHGICPKDTTSPHGKELNISFIGPPPFITYNPMGGSDFLLTKLLAEKFRFLPKFLPEKSRDIVKSNETSYGMMYMVG